MRSLRSESKEEGLFILYLDSLLIVADKSYFFLMLIVSKQVKVAKQTKKQGFGSIMLLKYVYVTQSSNYFFPAKKLGSRI